MASAKSVVLSCAGIGSRLGLGQTKALIPIKGKTLIAWQLELLQEVEDLRIVIGFQASEVVKEVTKYRRDAIFIYNHNYFETKTGASFFLGARDANEYVIEWDGDLLVHPDDINAIIYSDGEYVGYSEKTSDEAVYVQTDEQGQVLRFSRECGDFEWTGPACIKKSKLSFNTNHVFNMFEPYLPMAGLKIRACDIDTYDDYQRAIKFVESWGVL